MGQKVNPHGARVGVIYGWDTRWYANKKEFANYLVEDFKLREMLKNKYYAAGISKIEIDRTANMVNVVIWTSKPGMIIGQKGATIDQLKEDISPSSRTSVQPSVLTASPFRMSRPIFQADMRQSASVTSAPAR